MSKHAENFLEKGKEALDEKTGAVEQHKVTDGQEKIRSDRVCVFVCVHAYLGNGYLDERRNHEFANLVFLSAGQDACTAVYLVPCAFHSIQVMDFGHVHHMYDAI